MSNMRHGSDSASFSFLVSVPNVLFMDSLVSCQEIREALHSPFFTHNLITAWETWLGGRSGEMRYTPKRHHDDPSERRYTEVKSDERPNKNEISSTSVISATAPTAAYVLHKYSPPWSKFSTFWNWNGLHSDYMSCYFTTQPIILK